MNARHTLPVLRVEMVGTVTSFRYPHFAQVYQPTFEMPPPSTIYGHICSAVGDYVEPKSLSFGYHFIHEGKFVDYEHLWFRDGSSKKMIPYNRELLFNPCLTLYLTNTRLVDAFRSPYYPVVFGRSQDLMTYRRVEIVELVQAETGYFEHTLLPLEMAPRLREATTAVTMPRYIDPRRRPSWQAYALLQQRALWPQQAEAQAWDDWDNEDDDGDELLTFEGDELALWVDPDTPPDRKYPAAHRAVWLHSFVD
jgi:CRISPR-associated protein Cas5t